MLREGVGNSTEVGYVRLALLDSRPTPGSVVEMLVGRLERDASLSSLMLVRPRTTLDSVIEMSVGRLVREVSMLELMSESAELTPEGVMKMPVGRLVIEVSMEMLETDTDGTLTVMSVAKLIEGGEGDDRGDSVMTVGRAMDGRGAELDGVTLSVESDRLVSMPVVSIVSNEIEIPLSERVGSIGAVGIGSEMLLDDRKLSIETAGNESEGLLGDSAVSVATVGRGRERPVMELEMPIKGRLVTNDSSALGAELIDSSSGSVEDGKSRSLVDNEPTAIEGIEMLGSDVAKSVLSVRGLETE